MYTGTTHPRETVGTVLRVHFAFRHSQGVSIYFEIRRKKWTLSQSEHFSI
jgi:hypothetical protein